MLMVRIPSTFLRKKKNEEKGQNHEYVQRRRMCRGGQRRKEIAKIVGIPADSGLNPTEMILGSQPSASGRCYPCEIVRPYK